MNRLSGSIVGLVLALSFLLSATGQGTPASPAARSLVYHQITAFPEETGGIGQPILSGDGTTAVFAIAPGSADVPNRIYTIDFGGSEPVEVDAYVPSCFCGSWVDISEDGSTVISTDSMQLRIVTNAGEARTLVDLTSNEMSSIRVTSAGDRVFFLLARDTAPVGDQAILQRGLYVVEADGSGLRQIVGPDQLAGLAGVVPDQIQMLRLHTSAMDVSGDGANLVFGAYVGAQQAVFAVNADGGNLRELIGPVEQVLRVAIAGDGSRMAMDVLPDDPVTDVPELHIAAAGGGQPRVLASGIPSASGEPMQLSGDGTQLLISPQSYLMDTGTGTIRQLAVLTPGASTHTDLLVDGMPRATMDAEATRFLYAMRVIRCADCANMQEQLATLEIVPADAGDAPEITGASIEPAEIPLDFQSAATARATIEPGDPLIAVGVVALRDGQYDINVARDAVLHDDGQAGDATAGDGTFTNNAVVHVGAQARDDDTGPRTIRFQAEIETADGRRHAMAVDAGTITVVEGGSS
jgi:hypothetical protein